MKKVISGIIIGALAVLGAIYYLSINDVFGSRLLLFLKQPAQQRVVDKANNVMYLLPQGFKADQESNTKRKYGSDYVGGFHHVYDSRIGCEIRKESQSLVDVQRTYQEKTKTSSIINTSKGIQLNYFLVDPLSATQIMTTVLVSQNDTVTYVLTCGAGRAYHTLYAHDFANFFNSFSFVQ